MTRNEPMVILMGRREMNGLKVLVMSAALATCLLNGCNKEGGQGQATETSERKAPTPQTLQALTMALESEDIERAKQIFKADPSLTRSTLEMTSEGEESYSATILHFVVLYWNKEFAEFLLDLGANPNTIDSRGVGPLHVAVTIGRRDMVALLLENGADPNGRDSLLGSTPIYGAVVRDDVDLIKLLVGWGAGTDVKDNAGSTPLDFAMMAGSKNSAEFLRNDDQIEAIRIAGLQRMTTKFFQTPSQEGEVKKLIAALQSDNSEVRHDSGLWLSFSLEKASENELASMEELIPVLTKMLEDSSEEQGNIPLVAANALASFGPRAKGSIPSIIKASGVDWMGIYSLHENFSIINSKICPPAKEDISEIMDLLTSDNWRIRLNAVLALSRAGPDAENASPLLKELLSDESPDVRKAATEALEISSQK